LPVFISYSHSDKDFVDKLAAHIVANRGSVWLDRWELNVGDSLTQRIQEAITTSSALLVVLSKASVESEWCKRELNAGLVRELEEKRVVVLPVLLEDCAIPLFLRDKLYADFRTDFDTGFKAVLEGIAAVTNPNQSRIDKPEYTLDWSQDWGFNDEGHFVLRYTIVESLKSAPVTVLTTIAVTANDAATRHYERLAAGGFDWFEHNMVARRLHDYGVEHNVNLLLEDATEKSHVYFMGDSKGDRAHQVVASSRRMGSDTGKIQLVQISNYLRDIQEYTKTTIRKLTDDEQRKLYDLLMEARRG
jgi:hypothetical protein